MPDPGLLLRGFIDGNNGNNDSGRSPSASACTTAGLIPARAHWLVIVDVECAFAETAEEARHHGAEGAAGGGSTGGGARISRHAARRPSVPRWRPLGAFKPLFAVATASTRRSWARRRRVRCTGAHTCHLRLALWLNVSVLFA